MTDLLSLLTCYLTSAFPTASPLFPSFVRRKARITSLTCLYCQCPIKHFRISAYRWPVCCTWLPYLRKHSIPCLSFWHGAATPNKEFKAQAVVTKVTEDGIWLIDSFPFDKREYLVLSDNLSLSQIRPQSLLITVKALVCLPSWVKVAVFLTRQKTSRYASWLILLTVLNSFPIHFLIFVE